jgi:hypothetical protein
MSFKKQITNRIGRSKVTAGLEIIIFSDGTKKINLSLLRRKGTVIEIVSNVSGNTDYSTISKDINRDIPVNIVISGHGIISKKIAVEGIKGNELIHKVLPNANEKDFYIQNIEADNNHVFISLVRKEAIDKILQELSELKLEVISCSFGPFCISNILPIICSEANNRNSLLKTESYNINVKDGKIDSIQIVDVSPERGAYKIGEDELEERYLLSYSSAMRYFTQDSIPHPIISKIESSASNYIEKRIFSLFYKRVLASALFILLVNYFLFNHFFNKQNELQAQLDTQKSSIEKYDTLKSVLSEKEDFLQKSGFLGEPKTSFYADQLAKDIPPAITLNQMNINPLKKSKNPEDDGLSFTSGVINLLGICKNIIEFNNWIKILKELNWVKELKVLNYNHDKEGDQNRFSVEIVIK